MGKVRVAERIRGSWREKGVNGGRQREREREREREINREREKEREGGKKISQSPMPFNREQNQTELIM